MSTPALLLFTGILPETIGGLRIVGGVLAVFVVGLFRGIADLYTWIENRHRRARAGKDKSSSGD